MNKKRFIGVDVSKKTLDIAIYSYTKEEEKANYLQVTNNEAGFKGLVEWLKSKRIRPSTIAICLESTGIYSLDLCLFLEKHKYDYCALNPLHIKHSQGLVRGKSDRLDAFKIAGYCYLHWDTLVYSHMKDSTLMRIKDLMTGYKLYTRQAAAHKGLLTDRKDRKETTSSLGSKEAVSFLEQSKKEIEEEILHIIEEDDSFYSTYKLLNSIVGIGFVNAVQTIIHTNKFTAFDNARQYACYVGVAPFEHSSGTSIRGKTRVSRIGALHLKADLTQAASSAQLYEPELHEYYVRKSLQGKSHGCIMNAIKFKLIARMFAVKRRGSAFVKREKDEIKK